MASLKLSQYRSINGVHKNQNDLYSANRKLDPVKPSISEIRVGGIAHMVGRKYKVVEAELKANCKGCDLLVDGICQKTTRHPCSAYSRSDQTWVIFKLIEG